MKDTILTGASAMERAHGHELRSLIADATRENIEDLVEDMVALSSDGYLRSAGEARADYKKGRIKRLED